MNSTSVYLADLRYNYSGILANDCMPLGVAYMKAVMDRDLPADVHSRLFAYPDRLLDALKHEPPDVLMVSNYVWNEALSCHFAKIAKRIKPDILTVMGGPNICIEPERQIEFMKAHPEIDIYVLGEGDFLASEIVENFLAAGKSVARLTDGEISSSVFRRSDGEVVRQPMWNRKKEVDEIPSPWLTGIQDEFFDGRLAPMIETNRGCPFTCTFCCQGTGFYTKVHNFGLDRMRDEILYIATRVRERSPRMGTLRIADSNYGMFERDIEISSYIGQVQKDFKWPTFIDATTGKNRPDRIIKSLEQVGGALVLYQAVQSLDDGVLRNIKRQTIKLEAYEQLQVHMRGRGLRSNSDLILGLPGETLETHTVALHKLLDSGIDQLHNFQAMLLKGAEMESLEVRKQFNFQTGFRVLPKNFGVYDEEIVLDVEEIVTATDTLPFEDYVTARKYHLNSSVFWNDSWFQDVVELCGRFGIKKSQWWQAMLDAMENSSGPVRHFLDQFVHETINELFPTREACIEFYKQPENFARLQRGEIGDNLMYKYRALASFQIWPEICALAMDTSKRLLKEVEADEQIMNFDEFWEDLHRYEELKHAHGMNAEQVVAPATAVLRYDIRDWLADSMPLETENYRLPSPTTFEFRLTPEGERELRAAMEVWTMSLKGLSKLVTRIQQAWQVRDCARIKEMSIATVA